MPAFRLPFGLLFNHTQPAIFSPHPAIFARLLGKNVHGTGNAVLVCAVFYLVARGWHGSCFAYWQAGTIPRFTQNNKKPMTTTTDNAKLETLASFLGCEIEELNQTKWGHYGMDSFELGSKEYAIGTDSEANDACADYIRDSVWAFNSDFIVSECGLPYQLADVFKPFQHDKCESANDALIGLINATCGIESFVKSAISADGRGHFLSSYDGEENEEGEFFIYRLN